MFGSFDVTADENHILSYSYGLLCKIKRSSFARSGQLIGLSKALYVLDTLPDYLTGIDIEITIFKKPWPKKRGSVRIWKMLFKDKVIQIAHEQINSISGSEERKEILSFKAEVGVKSDNENVYNSEIVSDFCDEIEQIKPLHMGRHSWSLP